MKRIMVGALSIALLGILAYGAVKIVVIDPKTVSTVDDLLEVFYQARNSLPPLPCPVSYETIAEQLADKRVDFIASPGWTYIHDGGTYYLSEGSKLTEKLLLPATLLAYEDLASGKVVLACIPNATKKIQSLAVVDAPEFAPFDGTISSGSYLIKEFWPRRIIWSATLKPEADAWIDLVRAESENSLLRSAENDPIATRISGNPPEDFNGIPEDYIFSLGIENSGGQVQVDWYGLRGFSYQLQGIDNLLYIAYSGFENMGGSYMGGNTGIVVNVSQSSNYYFKVEATALDEDMDGLPDCWEFLYFGDTNLYGASDDPDLDGLLNAQELDAATHPEKRDTDDDGMWDNFEVYYAFDPLNGAASQPGDMGPEDDFDSDGITNLDEYNQGSFPHRSDFNLSETNTVVKWFGQSDWRYQLQGSATNLATGDWIDLGISRVGENREISVDVGQYSQPYFRVEVSGYDSDGDGLINVLEREKGTDPNNPDTDDDGMWDHFEVYYEFDPLNGAASQTGDMGPKDDFDGDGISNINEYNQGTFPHRSDFRLFETNNLVEWFGQFGWHYQLQGATSLAATNWVDLGISRAGENKVFSVDVGQYNKPFIRVELSGIDLLQEGSYTSLTEVVYGSTTGQPSFSYYIPGNLTSGYAINRTVDTASALYNGLSSSPINGMLRIPAGDGPFPLAIIVHGYNYDFIPSEEGYLYLCDQLASHGIITATIDENYLNDSTGRIAARALVLLEHVKQFKIWNETVGHPLENRVDMSKIMLIGHSRGGEALEHASFFNRLGPTEADPATGVVFDGTASNHYLGPYGFNLKALVAIAPTEGRYYDPLYPNPVIRRSIRDNYFIIHGSNDGDVDDFQGYKTYDRAHPVDLEHPLDNAEGCKALLWIHGANHNRFNTVWGSGNTPALSYETHINIAKYYTTAIAYAKLYGFDFGLSAFRDNRFANTFLPSIDLVTQYQDASRRFINHYDDDDDLTTLSDPHDGTNTWSCALSEIDFLHDVQVFHKPAPDTNHAACMQWSTAGKEYTVNLADPLDAGSYNVLSCRIAQYFTQDNDIQIGIEVSDGVAAEEFDLSDYSTVRYPTHTAYDSRRVVMQTVRIPLADIMEAGVDIHSIKGIKLKFSHPTPNGVVYFDDLQLSK